jgi:hypothetical protein
MTKTERTAKSSTASAQVVAGSSDGHSAVSSASRPAADEQIRMRAYELYRERGGRVGDDMADWLQAEHEYLERAPRPSADPTRQGASASAPETRT